MTSNDEWMEFKIEDRDGRLDCAKAVTVKSSDPTIFTPSQIAFTNNPLDKGSSLISYCLASFNVVPDQKIGTVNVEFIVSDGSSSSSKTLKLIIKPYIKPIMLSVKPSEITATSNAERTSIISQLPKFELEIQDPDQIITSCDRKYINVFSGGFDALKFDYSVGGNFPVCTVSISLSTPGSSNSFFAYRNNLKIQAAHTANSSDIRWINLLINSPEQVSSPLTASSPLTKEKISEVASRYATAKAADPKTVCTVTLKNDFAVKSQGVTWFSLWQGEVYDAIPQTKWNAAGSQHQSYRLTKFVDGRPLDVADVPSAAVDDNCTNFESHIILTQALDVFSDESGSNKICVLSAGSHSPEGQFFNPSLVSLQNDILIYSISSADLLSGCNSPSGKYYLRMSREALEVNSMGIRVFDPFAVFRTLRLKK